MSLLKDMADLLEDQAVGTVGDDIFYGQLPDHDDAPNACIATVSAGAIFLSPKYKRDELTFQVLIRSDKRDFEGGNTTATAVMNALLGIANQTVNGNSYLQWNIIGGINTLGEDSRQRSRFSINFRCVQENASGGARSTF